MSTATETWRLLLALIEDKGREVDHSGRTHEARSVVTREVVGSLTAWPMGRPVVSSRLRKLGRRFLPAEPWWILRGSNSLSEIAPYAPHLSTFSDDGRTLAGSYGPPIVDQLPYVVRNLSQDGQSRQAVISIWRPRPYPSRDVPCTLSLQWLLREGRLHCVASMRSSDAWLGVPYDVATFSVVSAYLAILLGNVVGRRPVLGELRLLAGSQHLYERDWAAARDCASESGEERTFEDLDVGEFDDEQDLLRHLKELADRVPPRRRWLSELLD